MVVLQNAKQHIQYPFFSAPFFRQNGVCVLNADSVFVSLYRSIGRKDNYVLYSKVAVYNR